MRNYLLLKISLFILAALLSFAQSAAQCVSYPPNATSSTPVSCRGGSDGTITVTVVPGASGFHSVLLQRYDIGQNKFIDIQGPIPTAETTYTFTGLTASQRYRVVTFDADEVECDAPAITSFIAVSQPSVALRISLIAKSDVENCFGDATGNISVTATGGNSGYEYTINGTDYFTSGTFSNLIAGDYTVGVRDAKGCVDQIPVAISQPAQLVISLTSQTDPLCAGGTTGSIAVSVSGGTPDYLYSINGGTPVASSTFNSLPAGTYTIEVTDSKGCKAALPDVTLADPPVLVASINTKTDVSCNGTADGSATVDVSGGTAPYTFNWNTSPAQTTATATGLQAGTYTVTVTDANGCTQMANVTISEPASVAAPAAASDAICTAEEVPTLTASGTDIKWYDANNLQIASGSSFVPTVDNTVAGTYTYYVSQTVGGCESPKTAVTLTVNAVPAAPTATDPGPICTGQPIPSLSATGTGIIWYDNTATVVGTGNTFTPSIDNVVAGTYTFYATQTENDCESNSAAVTITINQSPATPAIGGTSSFCQGGSTVLTSSAAGGNQWYKDGALLSGATSRTLTVTLPGSYWVTVTGDNGCLATSEAVTVTETAQPAAPVVTDVAYCQGATASALTATGSSLLWYTTETGGSGGSTAPVPSTATVGTTDYYVSQTIDGCESPRARITVTINANPDVPTINGNTTFCLSGSTVLTSSAAGGNQWYRDGVAISGANNQTLTVTQEGIYSVTVTNGSGCSASSAGVTVTQVTVATPTVSGTLTFCAGSSTTLTSSAATGNQWNLNGSPIAGATGQTLTVTLGGDYTVTVTQDGCSATSAAARVSVTPVPAAPTASGNSPVCEGGTINLTASTVAGATYAWTGPNGFTSSQQNPSIANATTAAAGTYSVTVTVNGCTSQTATVNITVDPQVATPTISGTNSFCQGSSTTLTSSAATGNQWYRGGVAIPGATGQILAATTGGTYTVTTTFGACSATSAAFTVTENSVVTPTISGTLTFCAGGSTTLTSSAAVGNQWNLNGSPVSGATGQTLTVTAGGDYSITVTQNGCTATSAVAKVTVTPVPAAPTASANSPVCAGTTLNLSASTVAGATYTWTGPNGFTSSQQNPSIVNATTAAAGTYSVTVTVNGCISPAGIVDVIINAAPATPTISGTLSFCGGSSTTLTSSAAGGNQWYRDGSMLSGQTSQTLTVTSAGSYSVTVTGDNGCQATSEAVTVTEIAQPSAPAVADVSYCQGATASALTATGTNLLWYSTSTGGTGSTTALVPSTATVGTTDYYVSQTVDGCESARARITVTVNSSPAAPVASSNGPICEGSTLTLTASSISGAAYSWTGPNGFTATGQNISIPNAATAHSGTYTVTVTVSGCTNAATVDVTVNPQPATPVVSGGAVVCDGSSTVLSSSASSGNQWFKDAVAITGAIGQNLTVTAVGNYHVVVTNIGGCSAQSAALTVTSAASFTVSVTGTNPNNCTASNGSLTVNVSPAGSYAYSLDGTDFSNTSGIFNGLGAGSYTVYVKNMAGCIVQQPYTLSNGTLSVDVSVTGETACDALDGTITMTPSGGASPYTYSIRTSSTGNYFQIGTNELTGLEPAMYWLKVTDSNNCSFEATATVVEFDCSIPPCTLTASGAKTDPTCSDPDGGSVTLTASGGTTPYAYSLDGVTFQSSNVLIGLSAGTYDRVTVRDAAGCTQVLSFTLTAPAAPAAPAASSPAPLCVGSAVPQLTATGSGLKWYSDAALAAQVGTGSPFTPMIDNTVAGSSTFYVTQMVDGCESTATAVTVTFTAPPDFSLTKTDPAGCTTANGSITVADVTGGVSPYQYSINGTTYQAENIFSGLGGGNYTVYVKDANGCFSGKSISLAAPGGFTATVIPSNETGCNLSDGIISVTDVPNAANTYTYYLDGVVNWAGANINVFTGLTPGTYTVTVEAADGCTFTTSTTVGTDCVTGCSVSASVTALTNPACDGGGDGSLTIGATGGSGTYEYSRDGSTFQASATFTGLSAGDYTITVRDINNPTCQVVLSGVGLTDPSAVAASVSQTDPTCANNDGSLTITATGGDGTYSYSVDGGTSFSSSNVFGSLPAGTYTVVVRDGKNCSVTLASVTLNAGAGLTASVSSTNPSGCSTSDGMITVSNVTGGTGPYSYSLDGVIFQSSNTFTNLTSGSYTVYIRDVKGCQITRTQTLTAPAGITATASWTNETACNAADGSVTVTNVSGATGPYRYFIDGIADPDGDGIFTGLVPNAYTIRVVAANNCEYTTTVTVSTACTTTPVCTLTASSSKTDPMCADVNGGSITVTPSDGTAPYSYAFNSTTFVAGTGSFTNLPAGDYNITVTDANGCTFGLNTITLVAPTVPAAPLAGSPAPICAGSAIPTLTASGTNIKWYDGSNVQLATGSSYTPTLDNTVVGNYSFYATQTANGCESDKTTVTLTINAVPTAPAVTDVAYCQGAMASTLTATGTNLLWYTAETGGTGSTTAPVPSTATVGTADYYVSQTVDGCESPRARLSVTINSNLIASVSITADQTSACSGTALSFTAIPTNGGTAPAFQWQVNGSNVIGATGTTFTSRTLNNSDQVTVVMTAGGDDTNCVTGSPATSDAITVTVSNNPAASVSIAADQTSICPGTPVTFTATATNGGTAPAYQWFVNGNNVPGATNVTFTSSTLNNNDVVTVLMTAGGTGTECITGSPATSNAITMTVSNNLTASVSISADQTTICTGTSVTFTATPTNGGSAPTYQWQINGTNMAGATTATFTSSTLAGGDQVSVVMTAGGNGTSCISGSPAASNVVTITVSSSLTASVSIAADQTSVCPGTAIIFTATPANGGTAPSYQWQVNGSNVAGATGTTFTSSTLNNNDRVTVVMTPGSNNTSCISGGPVVSNAVDVTVSNSLAASVTIAADRTGICAGSPVTFTATPQNGGTAPTYQWRINGVNVAGATNGTFTRSTLNNNDQVSVVMTAGGGNTGCITGSPAASNAIGVTVNNNVTAAVTITADQTNICAGSPVVFTATPTNGGTNPTYQWQVNGTAVAGAVNATFTSTLANGDRVSVVMTAGGTGTACTTGSPAASNEIAVNVTGSQPASVSIAANANNVCVGTAVTFTAFPVNGGTAPAFEWRINGVAVAGATGTSFTRSSLNNSDVVTVVMTAGGSGTGCVTGTPATSNALTMLVKPITDPSCGCFVADAQTTPVSCDGGNDGVAMAFIKNTKGVDGDYLYTLKGSSAEPQNLKEFFVEFRNQLQGPFTISILDKVTGCVAEVSNKVGADVTLITSIDPVDPTCAGNDGKIMVTGIATTKGIEPFMIELHKDNVLLNSVTTATGQAEFINLSQGVYQVKVTDATPCTAVYQVTIGSVEPVKVSASIASQPSNCAANDGEITLVVTGGKAPFKYAISSINNGAFVNFTSGKIGQLAAGDYTISVRDANDCEATTTLALAVDAITFEVQKQDATCDNPTVSAKAVLPAGVLAKDYLFSINGTSFMPGLTGPSGEPEFKNLSPGTYTMYVRKPNGACPVTRQFTIGGVTGLSFEVSQVNVGCTGGAEGSITVHSITGGTVGNAPPDYGISIDGGNSFIYTKENTMTFNNLKPGPYQVVLAYGQCRTVVREVVITSSGIPFTVKTTPSTCGSPNGTAEAVLGDNTKKYFYSINNTNFFESPLFTNLKPGSYKMHIRENADDLCANVLPFVVPGPDSLKATIRREGCNNVVLSPIEGGEKPYRVSIDGGKTFISGNIFESSYIISNLKDGDYEVIVADNQDCRTFPVNLRISNKVTAKVRATLSMADEPTGEIQITDIRGGTAPYEVSLNGTSWGVVKDVAIPYDTVIRNQPIGYVNVYVRDANGCVQVYAMEVKESTFMIPNVFTPNGDGVNDTFFIRNLPPSTIVRIVNRWGKLIYESANYQNDWNGGDYPDGIYYYTVNIAGQGSFTGWVQIWH